MSNRILVFYGSYRSDRMGIRLAQFVVEGFRARGDDVELIDAKAIGLPMLEQLSAEQGRTVTIAVAARRTRSKNWPGRSAPLTALSS